MAEPVYEIVELVGTSDHSISKAIDRAIEKASNEGPPPRVVRGGADPRQHRPGQRPQYQVTVKAGFTLEDN